MKLRHTNNFYEGSGEFDLLNDNSIPGDSILVDVTGYFPVWDDGSKPISAIGLITWPPTIDESQVNSPICCADDTGKSDNLTDNSLIMDYNNESLLISLCSTIGLIIIASLVGFSFTKRPCSPENITSSTIGTSTNLVTHASATANNETTGIELTNISIAVGD